MTCCTLAPSACRRGRSWPPCMLSTIGWPSSRRATGRARPTTRSPSGQSPTRWAIGAGRPCSGSFGAASRWAPWAYPGKGVPGIVAPLDTQRRPPGLEDEIIILRDAAAAPVPLLAKVIDQRSARWPPGHVSTFRLRAAGPVLAARARGVGVAQPRGSRFRPPDRPAGQPPVQHAWRHVTAAAPQGPREASPGGRSGPSQPRLLRPFQLGLPA
jgi:hypothetical protein